MSAVKVTVAAPFQLSPGDGKVYGPGETVTVEDDHHELDTWLAAGWATSDDPSATVDAAQKRLSSRAFSPTSRGARSPYDPTAMTLREPDVEPTTE